MLRALAKYVHAFFGIVFDPSNETILSGPVRLGSSEQLVIQILII